MLKLQKFIDPIFRNFAHKLLHGLKKATIARVTISNLKFSRENPYQPMKSYTNGLQKTPEEKNAEFQDFMNSLMGPF